MNRAELIDLLWDIAVEDTVDYADIQDHPCSVAIRALDRCFEDVNLLKRVVSKEVHGKSKKCQILLGLNYDPEW